MDNLPQAPIPVPGPSGAQPDINRMIGDELQAGSIPIDGQSASGTVQVYGVHPQEADRESASGSVSPDAVIQAGTEESTKVVTPEIASQVPVEQPQPMPQTVEDPKVIDSTSDSNTTTTVSSAPVAQREVHQPVESVSTSDSDSAPFEALANDEQFDVGSAEGIVGTGAETPDVK